VCLGESRYQLYCMNNVIYFITDCELYFFFPSLCIFIFSILLPELFDQAHKSYKKLNNEVTSGYF